MLDRIDLENIRNFAGDGWSFPLSPLTIFCGTNSAGKSTIFKTLLLFLQTLNTSSPNSDEGRLTFVGPYADLGTFKSFVSHRDDTKDFAFSLVTHGTLPKSVYEFLSSLSATDPSTASEVESGGLETYEFESTYRFSSVPIHRLYQSEAQFELSELTHDDEPDEQPGKLQLPLLRQATYRLDTGKLGLFECELQLLGARMLGGRLDIDYELIMPKLYWERTASDEFEPPESSSDGKVKLKALLNGLIPILIGAKLKDKKNRSYIPLPPDMTYVLRELQQKLSGVHYIGPLRAPAKRYYITNVDSQPAMDAAGEFLPYVLKNRGDDRIRFPSPKQIGSTKARKLRLVLDEWVHYLRTGDTQFDETSHEVEVPSKGDVLLEFFLRDLSGTESHALADSGFGYSQVLPIIVRGLISRIGHTLMIEQPELHLNPALQVRLADFFVALIQSGRQVLLETHSEHIVNAVRVLAAEDDSNSVAPKISIFFIDAIDGRPEVTSLNIRPDGTVPAWPASFFGEALDLSSRLLISQGRARKISRK